MKKLILASLIAGATLISAAAHAENGYIGVGVANASSDFNVAGATGGSSSGNKASGKIFGGVELDKTFGVEGGYTDFRNSNYNYTVAGAAAGLQSKGHAFYIAGKANMALSDQFSLYGKLGVENTHASLSKSGASTVVGGSDNKTGVYAALGLQYALSKQVALIAEYERYGKKMDFGSKPNVWTVGAKYAF
jgi:opacity protein-like surface antigen